MLVWIKMNRQGPSKSNKRSNRKAFITPGSLSAMANRKQRLLTTTETVKAIRSEKENVLKLIENNSHQYNSHQYKSHQYNNHHLKKLNNM